MDHWERERERERGRGERHTQRWGSTITRAVPRVRISCAGLALSRLDKTRLAREATCRFHVHKGAFRALASALVHAIFLTCAYRALSTGRGAFGTWRAPVCPVGRPRRRKVAREALALRQSRRQQVWIVTSVNISCRCPRRLADRVWWADFALAIQRRFIRNTPI